MFLEWWMIVIVAIMTGLWAEYRNIKGREEGFTNGVREGAKTMLHILLQDKIIAIDDEGTIHPVQQGDEHDEERIAVNT